MRNSTLASKNFVPGQQTAQMIHDLIRVLVVGAGGLGCELLKDLALSGFGNLDVIDLDRIDTSNLNRQFLFRAKDVGSPKAEVAAKFVMDRVPSCSVTPHFCRIEDKDAEFYSQFHIIVLGLDSIDARRWMNSMIHSMIEWDDDTGQPQPGTARPIIDGGSEALKGHARVIQPGQSADFEDTLDFFPPQVNYPLCTLADTPRNAAHCIQWAKLIQWPIVKGQREPDMDQVDDVQWLFETASKRAAECGIEGVTLSSTLGVAKNIIPAVASTNAIVAAMCTNECLKLVTGCSLSLDNYCMYNGTEGVFSHTFKAEKLPWTVTSMKPLKMTCDPKETLEQFRERLCDNSLMRLKNPGIRKPGNTIYMPFPQVIEQECRPSLKKTMAELFAEGDLIYVTDKQLVNPLNLKISFDATDTN